MADNTPLVENPFFSKETVAPSEPSAPLHYEETPVIEPVVATPPIVQDENPSSGSPIVFFVILVLLFLLGIGGSFFLRWIPLGLFQRVEKTPEPTPFPIPSPTLDPYFGWKTYYVVSGVTRKAVEGISFKLPPEVAELFCDGLSCSSQGTYLPGGTRFTVAPRGLGQILTDYRGKIVTDFGGRPFVTTPTTVLDRPGLEFIGNFTGTTVTGYTFTKMRGVMVAVTSRLALEINHFTPAGVTADFASDDALFDKILHSFEFVGLPTPSPIPVLSPTDTPTATSSGS